MDGDCGQINGQIDATTWDTVAVIYCGSTAWQAAAVAAADVRIPPGQVSGWMAAICSVALVL